MPLALIASRPCVPGPRRTGRATRLASVLLALSPFVLGLAPPEVQELLPPCPIHLYLHLLCPGCGGTRAVIALLHGHVTQAWHLNALLLLLMPAVTLYAVVVLCRLWSGRRELYPEVPPPVVYGLLLVSAGFTLVRNAPR